MRAGKLLVSINSSWNFINFRSRLMRALVRDGFELVAAAPADGHVDQLTELGCRYLALAMSRRSASPFADMRLFIHYLIIMIRERPDAFLGYTIKPNIYGSLAAHLCGIPVANNIAGLGTSFEHSGWLNRIVRTLYRLALSRSKIVFFQNRDDLRLFVEDGFVRKERARLLPGSGVDLEHFRPAPQPRRHPDQPVFVLIARLLWAKGIFEYVEAARIVRRTVPGARFRIVGIPVEGEGAVDMESLVRWRTEGLIEFDGPVRDVRPVLADADCVVLPSFYPEGTPRGLLEAAAMGKPIITTDVPGCRDVVASAGNGYLCPPRDSEALAVAMRRFLDLSPLDRSAMGVASRRKAETTFDDHIVIDAYRAAIAEMLGASAARRHR